MADRPNVVIIMTDQQQARATARAGFPLDTTPFLDSLAAKGVWFDKAYTSSPQCAPARVSLLTGRYCGAHGIRANPTLHFGPRYEKDVVDVLSELGYSTAMVGKNHSHLKPDRVDHWYALTHAAGHRNNDIKRNEEEKAFDSWLVGLHHGVATEPTPFPVECQGPYRAVTDAANWVREVKDRPFFLWLTFAEPHNPYQVPEPYFSMFPPETHPPAHGDAGSIESRGFKWEYALELGRRGLAGYDELIPHQRRNYYGMLRLIDDQVRRFVGMLEEEGVLDDTIILFVSDHGDFVGDYGLMRKGPEIPESLVRIPFLVAGPGIKACEGLSACGSPAQAGAHSAHVNIVDVFPTVCEAVGVPVPDGVQGRSLWPLLTGNVYPPEEFASAYAEQGIGGLDYTWDDDVEFERALFPKTISFNCLNHYTQCGIMRMIRKGDWKLIYDMHGRGWLHDLRKDPGELVNLFDSPEHAGVRHGLVEELLAWCLRATDPLPYPGGPYERKSHPRGYWFDRSGEEDARCERG